MDTMFSYVIVASIVSMLAWQAYTHLNRGKRTHRSLITPIKIDDIEVSDFNPSNSSSSATLMAPRIEYLAENEPFPQSYIGSPIKDPRKDISLEIDVLKETNIDRYSIRERTTEKVLECNKLLELIDGLINQHNIELDNEIIEAPLEGLTLSELDARQTALLDLYDHLYQLSFEEEVQKVRRKQLELQTSKEQQQQSSIVSEISDLSGELELLRREEELYRDISSAQTIEFFEELDFSDFGDEAQTRLNSHYDFYHSRLSEKIKLESEFSNYQNYKDKILSSIKQEEIQTIEFEGVNSRQLTHLEEIRLKRIDILDIQDQEMKEEAKAAEIRLKIESADSSSMLDMVRIEGVNPTQEAELQELFTLARGCLVTNELHSFISNCEYVLELDALIIRDVNEEQEAELIETRINRRAVLVEVARQRKFYEQYTTLLDKLPRIDEIDILLEIEIDNVSESQKEELEVLRLSRLDYLEEKVHQRIEQEQAGQFSKLRKRIESTTSTIKLDKVVVEGVNEEQEAELIEIKEELRAILAEDEVISKHVEKAEKRRKKDLEPSEFLFDPESEFRTRSKTYEAGDGLLRFSLTWNNMNDLDMVVRTSKGDIIHRGKRRSSCGGKLDLEMNIQPQTKAALENIVWPKSKNPPKGTYNVFLWHRNRHHKIRKSDPTEYILRVRVGADYYQYKGKTSYGDKLFQIASIDVPSKKIMYERIEIEGDMYRHQRAEIMATQAEEEFPEIDPINSSVHSIMLSRLIDKQKAQLEEKRKRKFIANQKAEHKRVMHEIESAEDIESLAAVRYDDVSNELLKQIEKALVKRRKMIESGLKKKQQNEQHLLFEQQRTAINTATSTTELSSIIFDEKFSDKQINSLKKMRLARRKVLLSTLNSAELEKEKQSRLHQALNESYKSGGLQPLDSDDCSSSEFESRLKLAGAKFGDLNISLLWNNKNDLNLLVVTPSREVIHPRNTTSSDGGELDIEMNKKGETSEPIENIYWKKGSAKKGIYYVYVHLFKEHVLFKRTNLSEGRIQITNKGQVSEYSAPMSHSNKLQFITQIKVD